MASSDTTESVDPDTQVHQNELAQIKPPSWRTKIVKFLSDIKNNKNALIGVLILIPVFGSVIFAPFIMTHDPVATDYGDRYAAPSGDHFFGTDNYGRDLFSRTLVGGQSSLMIGIGSVALALLLGVPLGLISGYLGGRTDELIMRSMDVVMTFPTIVLALLILITITPSIWAAIFAVGIVMAPKIARVVRSSTLSIKHEEFVKAAEQRGESMFTILFSEILPNIRGPIMVEGTIRIGYAIMIGAALSFLGLGVQPPTPDWGYMVAQARDELYNTPWFLLWPSFAIAATILGFNLLGDGLSDIFDKGAE